MTALLSVAVSLALAPISEVPQGDQVVATVDGVAIRAKDVDKALWDWYSADVVEEFIANTLVANALKSEGVVLEQREIDAFLNRLLDEAKAGMDPGANVEAELKKQGMPKSRLAARAATEMGIRKLTEARFKPAELRKIAWIMIKPEGSLPEQKAAAKMNADQTLSLLATQPWADVARAKSQDANSAVRGGELGWFAPIEMPKDVAATLGTLPVGGHSGVIDSQGVFAIYKVVEIGAPLSDVDALKAGFVARNLDRVYQELKAKAKVERKTG